MSKCDGPKAVEYKEKQRQWSLLFVVPINTAAKPPPQVGYLSKGTLPIAGGAGSGQARRLRGKTALSRTNVIAG